MYPPPLHFGHGCVKAHDGRIIDCCPGLNRRPVTGDVPVNFVVTAAMNCTQVGRIVGATLPLLDQMVRRVGARLAADMADASVACDHRCRQLAPCLRAVGTIYRIAAHALCRLPAGWPVDWRLPWHLFKLIGLNVSMLLLHTSRRMDGKSDALSSSTLLLISTC